MNIKLPVIIQHMQVMTTFSTSATTFGPYKVNGVPLRRVNQAYVIGTSTKVDVSGLNVEKYDDKYFSKQADKKKKKGESEFFEAEKQEKNALPAKKKEDQKAVDASLLKAIESLPELKQGLFGCEVQSKGLHETS